MQLNYLHFELMKRNQFRALLTVISSFSQYAYHINACHEFSGGKAFPYASLAKQTSAFCAYAQQTFGVGRAACCQVPCHYLHVGKDQGILLRVFWYWLKYTFTLTDVKKKNLSERLQQNDVSSLLRLVSIQF